MLLHHWLNRPGQCTEFAEWIKFTGQPTVIPPEKGLELETLILKGLYFF